MKMIIYLLFFAMIISCKDAHTKDYNIYATVEIEEIYNDTTLSIRAIELLNDKSLAFAANNGVYGLYSTDSKSWMTSIQKYDTLFPHFRAVANTSTDFYMLSIENPALLYKTGDDGHMELVYKEEHPNVFYDAMAFWNDREGIAIGDPIEDCLNVIITRDGRNWNKLTCESLPPIKAGEAAFAASNSNIAIVDDYIWVATGGKTSRVLFSPDKGVSWQVFETPMADGKATTGIYSISFYDQKNGFAIGGDYTDTEMNQANKIVTADGGKTWRVVADGEAPGYSSCVQYIPNSTATGLVAVGTHGIYYSCDKGINWKQISEKPFHTIRFLNDSTAYAAGDGVISKLLFQ